MNKPIIYLLLTVFCLNIFGRSMGEFMHLVSHAFENTHTHHHHSHDHTDAHVHQHDGHSHSHHKLIHFLTEALDINSTNGPLDNLAYLSLLMQIIDGILPFQHFSIQEKPFNHHTNFQKTIPLKTNYLTIPTPPPDLFS